MREYIYMPSYALQYSKGPHMEQGQNDFTSLNRIQTVQNTARQMTFANTIKIGFLLDSCHQCRVSPLFLFWWQLSTFSKSPFLFEANSRKDCMGLVYTCGWHVADPCFYCSPLSWKGSCQGCIHAVTERLCFVAGIVPFVAFDGHYYSLNKAHSSE